MRPALRLGRIKRDTRPSVRLSLAFDILDNFSHIFVGADFLLFEVNDKKGGHSGDFMFRLSKRQDSDKKKCINFSFRP